MNVAVIKYNAGNIQSVLYALGRLGVEAKVTDDPEEIQSADRVIFPGVGEASSAMRYLKDRKLDEVIKGLYQPVLGICLGMQLMCRHSEENDTGCLGIFNVNVKKFVSTSASEKIPQIGWNTIYNLKSDLFEDLRENSYCYFVHSFYAEKSVFTIAETEYTKAYSSGLRRANFYGVQFHPEKSAAVGEKIITNFLNIAG
ncbi:imidazole glycerol phosphate synthase subunit HisH [Pollutibacter soli]|uniref:imidazole glycerol phosphate synthase subunit HisH n=1 Tax=Pollutibacter soli TaxID=3034157 RepID=UPI0030133FF3